MERIPPSAKTLGRIATIMALAWCAAAPAAEPVYNPPWFNPPDARFPVASSLAGTLIHDTLPSTANNTAIGYAVYLPPSYGLEPTRHFPVLWHLHPGLSNETSRFYDVVRYEDAMLAGTFPECVVVSPNALPLSFFDDHPPDELMETWVIDEFVPAFQGTWRVCTDPASVGVYGFSMGGYGAVKFGLLHPELFGHAVSLDGSLFPGGDESWGIWETLAEQDANSVFTFLDGNLAAARAMPLMLVSGGTENSNFANNLLFHERLNDLSIPHSYEALPGISHNFDAFITLRGAEVMEFQRTHLAPCTTASADAWMIQ